MKKTISKIMTALVAVAIIATSCGKDDTSNPVITLNGDKNIEIDLGATYTDNGATANDEEDGDLTSQITVSGTVNTNQVGVYEITYSVSDEAGNTTTETRNVYVKAAKLAGNYNYTFSSSVVTTPMSSPADMDAINVVASSNSYDQILIPDFSAFDGLQITATVSGTKIYVDGTYSFDFYGDGTVMSATVETTSSSYEVVSASNSRILTINYVMTYSNGDVESCQTSYVKQ